MTLQAEEIVTALGLHEVRYIVIGGLGAVLHGSPIVTQDAVICPGAPEGIPFPFEGAFLANVQLLNLTTPFGDLDLSFEPAGTTGYADLERAAVTYEIAGRSVAVASLDDIIRSKEAANREKDRAVLPTLRLHRRMLRERAGLADDDSSSSS